MVRAVAPNSFIILFSSNGKSRDHITLTTRAQWTSYFTLRFYHQHHLMRVLSSPSDVLALAPLRNEPKKLDSIVNERAETTGARSPNVTVPSTIPTVVLDTDAFHFQLARMPTSDNTTRASKKRHELLNSFDTLASHLYTTFIALSTALALRGSPEKVQTGTEPALCHHRKHGVARAFFAVALGPTVGTAKSRVIVGIDGLETRVWGFREDDNSEKAIRTPGVSEEGDNNAGESASDTDDEEEQSEDEESGGSGEEEGEDVSGSDDDASPPLSRSPSPTLSSDSDSPPSTSPPNPLLRAEDPETVRAAERLLSRTLASACAEDDGQGLASEMGTPMPYQCHHRFSFNCLPAPTQIHVLLRAPRRFNHPSWIPRQNLCTSLESYLADFLVESGQKPASCDTTTTKKRTKASKVQGVWVKSHGNSARIEGSEEDLAEEDELIWWNWDGKLVGFADW
ncbi:hypothetical protein J3R82DRAFT_3600 [Butyriboletus roseoflavus]|nr:hypothetical protein J3R82DRAFT_3600 [Butyriboletus roseoflavus]